MNLDCETPESTEQSLAAILQMERVELQWRIYGIKKMDFEVNTCIVTDRWLPILNVVAGRQFPDLDSGKTCWFHATRTKDLSSFRQGILPLPKNMNRIWDMLYPLVADCLTPEDWNEFRQDTVAENYGGHSEMVVKAWMSNEGPYAFLFSESALTPKAFGNHDYFSTSELIEWIAICFERKFGVSLHDRHFAATRPAFIKFWTHGIRAIHLGAAVDYLLHRHFRWSLTNVDPCFSADGEQILPAKILKAIPILLSTKSHKGCCAYSLTPKELHVPLHD